MPFWVKINGVPTRVNSLSNQTPVSSGGSNSSNSWYGTVSASNGNFVEGNTNWSTVISLPFYVTSSNSKISFESIAQLQRIQQFHNLGSLFTEILLDGQSITSSNVNNSGAAATTCVNGNINSLSAKTIATTTVGWHTASLRIKTDDGTWKTSVKDADNFWHTSLFVREG